MRLLKWLAPDEACWRVRYGSWWCVQWCRDGWLGLGIHVDFRRRIGYLADSDTPVRYAPYLDLHLGWLIVSVGVNPVYSGHLYCDTSVSRGGRRID